MVAFADDLQGQGMSKQRLSPDDRKRLIGIVERLEAAIQTLDVSQFELARRIGLSQSGMNEIFRILRNPKAPPRVPGILALSRVPDALGINGHWFLTGAGRMEDYQQEEQPKAAAIRYALATLSRVEQRVGEERERLLSEDRALNAAFEAKTGRLGLQPPPAVRPPVRQGGAKRG